MKKFCLGLVMTLFAAAAHTQSITPADLRQIPGNWKGNLRYLDYTSNQEVEIRSSLQVVTLPDQSIVLRFDYPNEPGYGSADTLAIGEEGRTLGRWKVMELTRLLGGDLRIVLEENAKDGNLRQPALIRYVLQTGENTFQLAKFVRYEGAERFIQRNVYVFSK